MTASDYRKDFPLLQNEDTIYIDNAATAQRPQAVLDAVKVFYETENANPLRGFYPLSLKATESCENARATVRDFIHATSKKYNRRAESGGLQLWPQPSEGRR